jgi:hypothetical protein
MSEIERLQRLAGIMPKTLSLQEDGEPDTGDTVTKTVVGHVDDEPDMIRQELYKMGKYCIDLYRMLGEVPNGDLPEWWTAKITKASDYIGTAKHYLEAELYAPKDVAVVITNPEDNDPSGVS